MSSIYDLLSKPTPTLSDADVEAIIADLRTKRDAYVKTGKADKPTRKKAETPAEVAEATADIASQLGIDL